MRFISIQIRPNFFQTVVIQTKILCYSEDMDSPHQLPLINCLIERTDFFLNYLGNKSKLINYYSKL